MNGMARPIIRSGLLLGLIALIGTGLLAFVNAMTRDRIVNEEQQRALQQLNEIVPLSSYNNNMLRDVIKIRDPAAFHFSEGVLFYRARMDGEPVAILIMTRAPDGYNGDIRLLIGIDHDGSILGVRVVSHRETPGLGDPIDIEKSDWILGFNHKSLLNPQKSGWAVKRDGGKFDQFTGATISPRAVVRAVHTALLYFDAHEQQLFDQPAREASSDH